MNVEFEKYYSARYNSTMEKEGVNKRVCEAVCSEGICHIAESAKYELPILDQAENKEGYIDRMLQLALGPDACRQPELPAQVAEDAYPEGLPSHFAPFVIYLKNLKP